MNSERLSVRRLMQTHHTPAWRGRPQRIACINKTKHVPLGVPFGKLTATLQKCYDRHFLPVWGFPVKLYNTRRARAGDWQLIYVDDAKDASTDGEHLTLHGAPVAYVYVQNALAGGEQVSLTASHELFELAIDPMDNLWAEGPGGWNYAYEMCDAVEDDRFPVDGLAMSNFVYPAWFEPFKHRRGTKYDHMSKLKRPFSISKGGYIIIARGRRVHEKWGSAAKKARFKLEDRRGHRSEYRNPNGLRLKRGARRRSRKKRLASGV
jgi:hypothetical protein